MILIKIETKEGVGLELPLDVFSVNVDGLGVFIIFHGEEKDYQIAHIDLMRIKSIYTVVC